LASRRVEFRKNTYKDNVTVDLAILNGLAIEGKASKWRLANDQLVGDSSGLDLPKDATGVSNYRTSDVLIHDNSHSGGCTKIDAGEPGLARQLGLLLYLVYGETKVDGIVYDGWGESSFDAKDSAKNSNDNRICVKDIAGATVVNLHLDVVLPEAFKGNFPKLAELFRPAAPFAPYDCDAMAGGAIVAPTMPQLEN